MNTEDAHGYFKRAIAALGQGASDAEMMALWCYDHPPKKPLPKSGHRERHVYISRRVVQCLSTIGQADALADGILLAWVKEQMPEIFGMFERHDQEADVRIAELRRNEPELQPQEDPA